MAGCDIDSITDSRIHRSMQVSSALSEVGIKQIIISPKGSQIYSMIMTLCY